MIEMTLAEIAAVVGGAVARATDAGVVVSGPAYVDSRTPEEQGLYVAIVGDRVDGHDFADHAHAVLGTRATPAPTVVVSDPVVSLGKLARHVRDRLGVRVVALTGSQGKTGTKDALAQILASRAPTVGTAANLNNELGVPLTVLRATPETAYLVVEMGARGVGHIAYLCEIARPEVAAVLNIGTAHIAEFGSREQIAVAKGEIVEALTEDGTAVLNADDPLSAALTTRTAAKPLSFGESGDVSWAGMIQDERGRPSFDLSYRDEVHHVELQQSGAHQVANAAAAVALAVAVGVPFAAAATALNDVRNASRWRMEVTERPDGLLVINDAYNANPASMVAALDALAAMGKDRPRTIAVLGVMLELGDEAAAAHLDVGKAAGARDIDVVLAVGEEARGIAEGASAAGSESIVTAGRGDALAWLRNNVGSQDVVLVKASRGAGLEVIADGLLDGPEPTIPEGASAPL